MKGFCCDRCQTWYGSEKGARLQIRKGDDADKNNPAVVDLCNRCVSELQQWLVSAKKKEQP